MRDFMIGSGIIYGTFLGGAIFGFFVAALLQAAHRGGDPVGFQDE